MCVNMAIKQREKMVCACERDNKIESFKFDVCELSMFLQILIFV